jgi:HPt (histidine-containing phosphotransfer) domain-containing protein
MENNTGNKPYDLTEIKAMCDNNMSFLERLLVVFTDTLKTELANVKQGAAEGDWETVGKAAHKIKPSLIHFNVTSLTDVIFGLEHHENSNPEQLNALVVRLESVLTDVLVNLKEEFPDVL